MDTRINPTHLKLAGFVFLWREIANCFDYGADAAFLLALALCFGTVVVGWLGIEVAMLSGPLTANFIVRGALWLVIYFWLAPWFVRAMPFSITFAGFIGLAFVGAWGRGAFFAWLQAIDGQWFRDRSEGVLGIVMGALGACCLSELYWGSVLPLFGYVLIFALPLSCGWLARTPTEQWKYDANFGTAGMFHDVGASDEV